MTINFDDATMKKLKNFLTVLNEEHACYRDALDDCSEQAIRDRDIFREGCEMMEKAFDILAGDLYVLVDDPVLVHKRHIAVKLDKILATIIDEEEDS